MSRMKKPVTAVFFILLFILFIIFISPKIAKVENLKERSRNLEEEVTRLRIQNRDLETELRLLRDDPVYVEKVAREKFNKAKEGEIVYKVVREQVDAKTKSQ